MQIFTEVGVGFSIHGGGGTEGEAVRESEIVDINTTKRWTIGSV